MAILQADVREQPHTGDWEKGLSGKDGYPVFALILVFILIAMTAVASGRIDTTAGMPYVLGATIGPALLFWGIAYAVTIRHASLAWQIGSFAGVTLVALLYFAGVMGTASTAAKHDVAMLAEVRIDPEGMAILPADPDRGPVSRVFIAHYTELNAILRDRRALLKSSGLGSIVDPQALSKTPSLLRDCPRFGRAKTSSDAAVARLERWRAAAARPTASAPHDDEIALLDELRTVLSSDLDTPAALAAMDRWTAGGHATNGLVAQTIDALLGIDLTRPTP